MKTGSSTIKSMPKIFGLLLIASAIIISTGCGAAQAAQHYPTPGRNITVVVPFGAGGGVDLLARIAVVGASEKLGVPVTVVNQAGGSTLPAAENYLKQKGDGYSVFFTTSSGIAATVVNGTSWNYLDNFKQVMGLYQSSGTLFVLPKSAGGRFDSLQEMVAWAKAHPGDVTIATSGAGTLSAFTVASLGAAAGTTFTDVPFDSSAAGAAAMAGGHVDAADYDVSGLLPMMQAGKAKMVAILGDERRPDYKDVPTAKELGWDVVEYSYYGLGVQKDTPDDVVQTLHDAFKYAIELPSAQAMAEKIGNKFTYADGKAAQSLMSNLYTKYNAAKPLLRKQ